MHKEKIMENMRQVDFSNLRFPLIVVYKNPRDYPGVYVARIWDGARNLPTDTLIMRKTLQEIREDIKSAGFITWSIRQQWDDPVIAEIWLR